MRHQKKFSHLERTASHRKAMLANMASSLIEHKRITTTLPKAKALRVYLEPLVTKSKEDTTHSRRLVFSKLRNKYAVKELFGVIAEKIADRPGGYLRILKLGHRLGDDAAMAMIEFVDFNEDRKQIKPRSKQENEGSGKTRRSRRSGKKNVEAKAEEAPKAEEKPVEEAPKAE